MRKSTIQIILVFLAAGLVYSQSLATACPTDSKFLNMIKKKDASIVLTNVLTGSSFTMCNEVWSTTGTCCSVTGLRTQFNNLMNFHKTGFENFMSGLKNVGKALSKISNVVSNKDDVKSKLTTAYSANVTQFDGMTVDQALALLDSASTYKADVAKFKSDGKGCFDAIVVYAGRMVCYGCAGTTQTGINNADGSTSVTQGSCDALLGQCYTTWKFMHRVGGMMHVVSILNKALKSTAPAPKVLDKPGFASITVTQIMDAFKDCNTSLVQSSCSSDDKAVLCKAHFNLMAPPKRANNDNLKAENADALPTPTNSTRLLQSLATETSGDIGISSTGLDLTKSVTNPTVDASVNTYSTDSGLTAHMVVGGFFAVLSSLVLLN